jgi:hypothetical protein
VKPRQCHLEGTHGWNETASSRPCPQHFPGKGQVYSSRSESCSSGLPHKARNARHQTLRKSLHIPKSQDGETVSKRARHPLNMVTAKPQNILEMRLRENKAGVCELSFVSGTTEPKRPDVRLCLLAGTLSNVLCHRKCSHFACRLACVWMGHSGPEACVVFCAV